VALIGDSHAQHWRGALEVVAQARRWRGLSITRPSCPFTHATPLLDSSARIDSCLAWNRHVREWLTRHPEVHTVFVAANARTHYRQPGPAEAGFRGALAHLPRTVRRVFILRDTPSISSPQVGCVWQAIAHHRRAAFACAQPRSANLQPDPLAAAGRSLAPGRVRVLDLSRFMCSPRLCFPVVGGALVRKDGGHLTRVFAATLGPYLLREVLQHR
jgi:hypothetical protein